jgi:ABC-type phosphate transport system auxiliary subunit|tara:strand:- start:437 stop:673 length:237 start_codon:yes stop_codon:yes gene_type:complete
METIITFIFGVMTSLILVGVIYGVNTLTKLNQKIEDLGDELEEQEELIKRLESTLQTQVNELYEQAIQQINERFKNLR